MNTPPDANFNDIVDLNSNQEDPKQMADMLNRTLEAMTTDGRTLPIRSVLNLCMSTYDEGYIFRHRQTVEKVMAMLNNSDDVTLSSQDKYRLRKLIEMKLLPQISQIIADAEGFKALISTPEVLVRSIQEVNTFLDEQNLEGAGHWESVAIRMVIDFVVNGTGKDVTEYEVHLALPRAILIFNKIIDMEDEKFLPIRSALLEVQKSLGSKVDDLIVRVDKMGEIINADEGIVPES